jgi:hypothetical protein
MSERARRIHVISSDADASEAAAERLRQGLVLNRRESGLRRPPEERADRAGFLGPRRSRQLEAHEQRVSGIYYAGKEAAFTFEVGTAIEHTTFATGTRFAAALEQELARHNADSLTGQYAEMLALDGLGRLRELGTEAMREYRSRTMGGAG